MKHFKDYTRGYIVYFILILLINYAQKTHAQFVDIPCTDCAQLTYILHSSTALDTSLCNNNIADKISCTLDNSLLQQLEAVYFVTYKYNGETPVAGVSFNLLDNKLPPPFIHEWFTNPNCVADSTGPVFSDVPTTREAETDPNEPDASVSWTAPTVTDNSCSDITPVSNKSPGDRFGIGDTQVIYTATDPAGNSQTAMFIVRIIDNQIPVITNLPGDIKECTDPGQSNRRITWDEPTASDNSNTVVTLNSNFQPGHVFEIGTERVIYTARDMSLNEIMNEFTVTVIDKENPIFTSTQIADINEDTENNSPTGTATWTTPTATDNSGSVVVTNNFDPDDDFPIGSTQVIYTATDPSGNVEHQTFMVIITDRQAPNFDASTLPNNPITVPTDTDVDFATVSWDTPTATDNSGGLVTVVSSPVSGGQFPIGSHPVTITAIDPSNNERVHTFMIVVQDNQDPVISNLPNSFTKTVPRGQTSGTVDWPIPTATDNSGGPVTLIAVLESSPNNIQSNIVPPIDLALGQHGVTYTATDPSGRTDMMSFTISVTAGDATGDPVISGTPSSVTLNTDLDMNTATFIWDTPTATFDSMDVPVTSSLTSPHQFPIGTTTVSFTAKDPSTNYAFSSFTVTVNDNQIPDFNPDTLPDITIPAEDGKAFSVVTWTVPQVSDNSEGTLSLTSTHSPGDPFGINPGGIIVTYTATDKYNNVATLMFTVTVTDDQGPEFDPPSINAISKTTDPSQPTGTASWDEPTASDNSGQVTVTSNFDPGDSFPIGTTEVRYTARDSSRNFVILSFNIIISDDESPVIKNLPANIDKYIPSGQTSQAVSWTPPTATDNSGVVTLTPTRQPGEVFDLGLNVVEYTAMDTAGNTAMTTFTITLTVSPDSERPMIANAPDVSQNTDPGKPYATVTWEVPEATDNNGTPQLESSHVPGSTFDIGVTVVTYTATDQFGNVQTSMFTVTVTDVEPPAFTSPPSDIVRDVNPDEPVTWNPPTATDNSNFPPSITSTHRPGADFGVGQTTVIYTATDQSNNRATVSFTVTLRDNEAPVITGLPPVIMTNTDPGKPTAVVRWPPPIITDNSGLFALTYTHIPGTPFNIGTHTVAYTAVDLSSNEAIVSFEVKVIDAETPVIAGLPTVVITNTDPGKPTAVVTWTQPTITDNSGADVILTSTRESGTPFNIGTHTVVYTAVDLSSNEASASFEVKVLDEEAPIIIGTPADITTAANPTNRAMVIITWTPPTATDNSGEVTLTASHQPGERFAVGTSTFVTYIAKDPSDNEDASFFRVTVLSSAEPPGSFNMVFSGVPQGIVKNTDPNKPTAVVNWEPPTAIDQTNSLPVALTSNYQPGDAFPIGISTVTYSGTDSSGNVGQVSFTVSVRDTEVPVISNLPTYIIQDSEVVTWNSPIATDNSGSVSLVASHEPGTSFNIGLTTVAYTATDPSNNIAIETFTVTIRDNAGTISSEDFFIIWWIIIGVVYFIIIVGGIIFGCIASMQAPRQGSTNVSTPMQPSLFQMPTDPRIWQTRPGLITT